MRPGSILSPHSINHDLCHIKAALRFAHEWGSLPDLPRFRREKVPVKVVRFITPEHFATLYLAAAQAIAPSDYAFSAGDWWRALLVTAYMTGWRIGDLLNLRREDLDPKGGRALIRHDAEGNEGKREESIDLHPLVLEHLQTIACFDPFVFPWPRTRRQLYTEFHRLQGLADIDLPCRGEHRHTRSCHCDGFHDLRRAFATRTPTA